MLPVRAATLGPAFSARERPSREVRRDHQRLSKQRLIGVGVRVRRTGRPLRAGN